jgi:hypothetical protein
MEPAALGAIVDVGLKLPELGRRLHDLVVEVRGPRVESRVLLYLQVAQCAILALGKERQGMLSDAARCNTRDLEQVEALATRMRVYLREDNVREPLQRALAGLRACCPDIERAAQGLAFRRRDKQAAAQAFMSTLRDLEQESRSLEYTFYPEYSGQGLQTLVPLFELVDRIAKDLRRARITDLDVDDEKLEELVKAALRDPAHADWIAKTAQIERRIVELQLAFAVKDDRVA